MADPGFPMGGANLVGGRQLLMHLRSKNLYVKTKELELWGGGRDAPWIRNCCSQCTDR